MTARELIGALQGLKEKDLDKDILLYSSHWYPQPVHTIAITIDELWNGNNGVVAFNKDIS